LSRMRGTAMSEISLRTGVWHEEQCITLRFPETWDVKVLWPKTPPALSYSQIRQSLEHPVGQAPFHELCRKKSNPLIIVDDPNRPTPAARVLPFLLRLFRQRGISASSVRILIATGTHAAPLPATVLKKIGPEAFATCRVMVHDAYQDLAKLGRTSFGTPVEVNREVLRSDLVIGIGGIYPNHTAGYGGGSKLALGVLGFRSIRHLHYGHTAAGWSNSGQETSFRQDLDEICKAIRLNTMVSLQVNADREVVRVDCGDPFRYYDNAVAFCRDTFGVPGPSNADVVVSNAFPNDLSLTFASMKGMMPFYHCSPGVSRIAIASCSEGIGDHVLYPLVGRPWVSRQYQWALRLGIMGPQQAARKLAARMACEVRRRVGRTYKDGGNGSDGHSVCQNKLWLYRPGEHLEDLPPRIASIRIVKSWDEILRAVTMEQNGRTRIKALVYPCAPLQAVGAQAAVPTQNPAAERGLSDESERWFKAAR